MQLSRDAIQRMFDGTVGGNGQGLSPSELSGLATEQWVDANYVSINYFNRLFQARNGETAVPPNDIRTTIDNIKATVGLWTEQYLSALGLGDGGGGGGAVALIDLVDVSIVSPHTGQALVYNASTGKWGNGDVGAVVSITAGIGLSGGTITSSGTIAINTTYQEYIAHGETAYGWGNHASAGYLTAADAASTYLSKTDAASTYLTIAFFRSLFKAYNSGGSEVVPNVGSVGTIDNIKAMFGFWTDQYLSALGQGSGGGGGAVALTDLVDVAIVSPQTGQVLVYNATTGKWVNGAATAGTVTSITAGTGLSGGTITSSGTIAINTTYQTYIGHGETAYGWGNHANAGYLTGITATMINNALGFTLSGTSGQTYNLTTIKSNAADGETAYGWGNHANAGYLTSSSGLNASNINSGTVGFAYLPTMYWANVAISNESKTNTSPQFANIRLQNGSSLYGSYLRFGDGDSLVYLTEDSDDHLKIYGKYGVEVSTSSGYNLTWNGNTVATQKWVNANYLSISFFRSLFRAYNSSDAEVVPNGGDTNTIDSIKAMFGFWTNYYLSALGQNSGGGGGGATALADLTDVAILSPQTGQVLVYNSSTGKWVNGDAGGVATTLSGLTDVAVQSPQTGQVLVYNSSTGKWVNGSGGGTTLNQPLSAINSAGLGTPTQSGVAIMWNGSSWTYQVPGGGGGGGGTVTSVGLSVPTGFGISGSPVTGSGTITISFNSGYALPTTADVNKGVTAYGWGNHANAGYLTGINSSMVTSALGYTPLSNTTTFWGQTQSGGVVSGSLSSVGSITMSGDVNMDTGKKIISDSKTLLEYDGSQVSLGYGFRSTVPTQIHGTNVIFYAGGTEKARVTNTGLQIGSAVLVWDSTNNALKVQKSDGTACNLYALGGVSALGFQAGSGGTDYATISSLNTNLITFPDNDDNDCSIKNNDGSLVLDTDGNSGYVKTCDLCSINGSSNWLIGIGGNAFFSDRVRSPKFYVDNTRYIYLDGTTLKYFDGSTSKTIVLQ